MPLWFPSIINWFELIACIPLNTTSPIAYFNASSYPTVWSEALWQCKLMFLTPNSPVFVFLNFNYRKNSSNCPKSNGWPNRATRSLNTQTRAYQVYSFQNVLAMAFNRDGFFDLATWSSQCLCKYQKRFGIETSAQIIQTITLFHCS